MNFINIDASSAIIEEDVFKLLGIPTAPVNNLYFENVHFQQQSIIKDWNCFEVHGKALNNTVTPWPPCHDIDIVN